MTVTAKVLIASKQAESILTTQYTSPTSTKTIIDKFTATNTTASPKTISVHLVPNAGSANSTNLIVDEKALAENETYTFPELVGHTLEAGSFISTIVSASTSVTIRSSGRQIT